MNTSVRLMLSTFLLTLKLNAQESIDKYPLADSIRAVQFLAEVNINTVPAKKESHTGISAGPVKLSMESGNDKEITFRFPRGAKIMAKGLQVEVDGKDELAWKHDWSLNQTYKLMISVATDSAGNFSLYTGYVFLPAENKWKLIGTCMINGTWSGLKDLATFYSNRRKNKMKATTGQVWVQRSNGSWKNMKEGILPNPVAIVTNHVDSIQQYNNEIQEIRNAITQGKTDVKNNIEGVYYAILKEGTGRLVSVNDTVVVHYKGYLFSDGSVFDQTKETPATFPLKRLIRGWQLGVPVIKTGGTIRLVIPSAHAYSIRTRAARIPPNSILVFDIEVVDVKSMQ